MNNQNEISEIQIVNNATQGDLTEYSNGTTHLGSQKEWSDRHYSPKHLLSFVTKNKYCFLLTMLTEKLLSSAGYALLRTRPY